MIRIARSVVNSITAHARREHPRECCGLLIGTRDSITQGWPAANLADGATRFLVDPRDHFAAIRAARAADLEVVGAYHSHPSPPAVPSAADLADANDPALLHVIVALGGTNGADVRGFYLDRGNFREVRLVPLA